MYNSSSLPPLSLSLQEVLVLDSFPSLPAKQSSSDFTPSHNVYFAASAQNLCERDACCGRDGSGGSGVSSLHTGF